MIPLDRRHAVFAGLTGLASTALGCGERVASKAPLDEKGETAHEENVTPAEDLMREHGVLNRILLVYEECARRLEGTTVPRSAGEGSGATLEALAGAADLVRRFVEEYHEKLEESFLFPRFERAGTLVDLVATLRRQHQAGRRLTDEIQRGALAGLRDDAARHAMVVTLGSFVRMYRPHEAREDTVLFPALRRVFGAKELDELGERFEEIEHERFGKDGFEGVVTQVARLEETVGVFDLNRFTPP